MPLVRTRALILQAFPYGDTSKILRLYTLEHGLRSVIAKGAQRPKSRYGGLLEPFTEGEAMFYIREGRDLHTLSGFDLLRSRQSLGRDLAAFAGASLLSELALRFGTEDPHPDLYIAITRSLDRTAAASPERMAGSVLSGVWEAIALLGYRPELAACVVCGRALSESEAVRFDVQAGGTACTGCRPAGRAVDPTTRAEVNRMVDGLDGEAPPTDPGLHRALLRVFLSTHLAAEQPLRSLEMFLQEVR